MSDWLTDEELNRLAALVDAARVEGDPDGVAGIILDDFLDSHIKQVVDELQQRRAESPGLTAEEIEALRYLRDSIPRFTHHVALKALDKLTRPVAR